MSSSIFNFEYGRKYRALPRREKWWHATVAAACGLVVAGSCVLLRIIYDPPAGDSRIFTSGAVAALSPRTEVLALGSSHVMTGLWPARYSMRLMNLTAPGLNLSCMEALLTRHLSRVPGLKVAILEVDDAPLTVDPVAERRDDLRDFLHLGLSPFDIPTLSLKEKCQVVYSSFFYPVATLPRATPHDWGQDPALPAVLARRSLGQRTRQKALRDAEWVLRLPGFWAVMQRIEAGYEPREAMKFINWPRPQAEQVIAANMQALPRCISMLRERGIKVVLLRLPKSSGYWKYRSSHLKESYDLLLSTLRQHLGHDPDVVFWDMTRSSAFSDRDFWDVNHLNIYGAAKVARWLDPRLRELIARGAAPQH